MCNNFEQLVCIHLQDNDGSFLAKMLGNCLIEVKRNFDDFIVNSEF